MDAVSVDGTDTGLQGRTAILDTGTTLIVAPAADAKAVHDAIPGSQSDGQGGFTVPCTTTSSVALTFGGTSFTIDPRDIAVQPVDPTNPNGDCVSGISAGDIGGPNEWLVRFSPDSGWFFFCSWISLSTRRSEMYSSRTPISRLTLARIKSS